MSNEETAYDLIVIGAGMAGNAAANKVRVVGLAGSNPLVRLRLGAERP